MKMDFYTSKGYLFLSKKRRFRTVPIGNKPVFITLSIPRVGCEDCGVVRQVKVKFADQRRSYTRSFERYVLDLCKHMTIQDVARHLNVGWDMIKDISEKTLAETLRQAEIETSALPGCR